MLEDVFQFLCARALPNQFLLHEGTQALLQIEDVAGYGCQHAQWKDSPDHCCHLQDVALIVVQAVNARRQHVLQCLGDRDICQVIHQLPLAVCRALYQCSVGDQRADDLLDVERVAFGLAENAQDQPGGQRHPQEVGQENLAVICRQRLQMQTQVLPG